MDPFQKLWMYESWVQDFKEKQEQSKYTSYLIGSFTNPKAVQDLMNRENNSHVSDDAEFEELSKKIHESNKKTTTEGRRRKRKILAK